VVVVEADVGLERRFKLRECQGSAGNTFVSRVIVIIALSRLTVVRKQVSIVHAHRGRHPTPTPRPVEAMRDPMSMGTRMSAGAPS